MQYTKLEQEYIEKRRPDLILIKPPSLDKVIVSFLAKYDVFVNPPTSKTNWGDVTNTLLGGPQIGLESMQVSGQKKQINTQEWTQWKQWALDHKDFEAYRVENIDKAKEKYLATLKQYEDPKVKDEINKLVAAYNKELNEKSLLGFLVLIFIVICVIAVANMG